MTKDKFKFIIEILWSLIILGVAIYTINRIVKSTENKDSLPVENIHKIDSVVAVNDSIKIVINQLDSIKDAKVIEVKNLNNDSTLLLFYELLSK